MRADPFFGVCLFRFYAISKTVRVDSGSYNPSYQYFSRLFGINSLSAGVPTIKMKPSLYVQTELYSANKTYNKNNI
jgi:hypothetical protein